MSTKTFLIFLFLFIGALDTFSQSPCVFTIEGTVFLDNMADGILPDDVTLPGLSVNLYNAAGTLIATTASSPLGVYTFTGVPPGTYYLSFSPPSAYVSTFQDIGLDDLIDSDIGNNNGPNTTPLFTIINNDITHLSAGFYQNATVEGLQRVEGYNSNTGWSSPVNGIACDGGTGPEDQALVGLGIDIYRNHFGSWVLWSSTTTLSWIFPGNHPLHDLSLPYDQHNGQFRLIVPPGQYILATPEYRMTGGAVKTFSAPIQNTNIAAATELFDYDNTGESNALINYPHGITASTPIFELNSGELFMDYSFGHVWQDGEVDSLICSSAVFTPSVFTAGTPYSGTVQIPYDGGNGASTPPLLPIYSSGVSGLTATISPVTLNSGAGTLTFNLSGTPAHQGILELALGIDEHSCKTQSYVNPANCAPLPSTPTGSSTYTLCAGQTATLNVNLPSGSTVQWYGNPNGTGSPISTSNPYVFVPSGSQTLYAFSNNGTCRSSTGLAVQLNVINLATPTGITCYNVCADSPIVLLTVLAPTGTGVQWKDLGGNNLSTLNPYVVAPAATSYYVAYATQAGCISSSGLQVTIFVKHVNAPTSVLDTIDICLGDSALLEVNIDACDTLLWYHNASGNGSPWSSEDSLIVSPPTDTTYYAYAFDGLCLSDALPMVVNVLGNISPGIDDSTQICLGDTAILSVTGIPSNTQVDWYTNPAGTGTPIHTGNPWIFTPSSSQMYYLFIRGNLCSTDSTLSAFVETYDVPVVSINIEDSVCESKEIIATSTTTPNLPVLWSTGETTPYIILNPNISYDTLWVTTENIHGCVDTAFISPVDLIIWDNPTAYFNTYNYPYAPNSIPFIDSSFTDIVTWYWEFGDGATSNETNPLHLYENQGTYQVLLSVENSFGCIDTFMRSIDINKTFIIPNVFSPNSDGFNDAFVIPVIGNENSKLEIFNRWGSKLFEAQGKSLIWDGRTRAGKLASQGTYYYILNLNFTDNNKPYTGHVTLTK